MRNPANSFVQKGFTLIELIIVFSVMVVLSSIGIASFVIYSHSQSIDTTIKDVRTALFTARSRALSQLRDSSCFSNGFTGQGYELKGYQVVMCCSFGPLCQIQVCNTPSNSYEIQAVYGYANGSGLTNQTCASKKFTDPGVTIDSSSKTTATYFFFASITGAVSTNAQTGQIPQLTLKGYSITKVASVSATGVVQ